MTQAMGTGKEGTLCFGGFECGNATYWEVRRVERRGQRAWFVYRTSVAVTEIGRYDDPTDAYAVLPEGVNRGEDLETSLGR